MEMRNSYDNAELAAAYAQLEYPGTYYLAYRDVPGIIAEHVRGKRALDFGCGTGRSTRFLRKLGFQVFGVDIAQDMIRNARALDPEGDYRLIEEDGLGRMPTDPVDLALSVFTFDNIPTSDTKVTIMRDLGKLLSAEGKFINLVSSPEIYVNEWASFATRDFPQNRHARSGDRVKIVITDIGDGRTVEDVVCSDEDYRKLYAAAGLELMETYRPLGKTSEPQAWVSETRIPPWVIYVLAPRSRREVDNRQ